MKREGGWGTGDVLPRDAEASRAHFVPRPPSPFPGYLTAHQHQPGLVLSLSEIADTLGRVRAAVGSRVVGQEQVIDEALVAFLARGHALLEGVPGTAKTLLVRSLGGALGARFGRIQFTPDLMPSDITGVSSLRDTTRSFDFHPGP